MKKAYFGLVCLGFMALVVMCVMLVKDGIEGGIVNFLLGYFGIFGCLYLDLRMMDWILDEQAREKRSESR